MSATLYSDNNGARVIVRHKGPAGRGIASGGTTGQRLVKQSDNDFDTAWEDAAAIENAVIGPAVAVEDNIMVFGASGQEAVDSGVALDELATVTALAGKVDKDSTDQGLSDQNFTALLKAKLEALSPRGYVGSFTLVAGLPPTCLPGEYAVVEDQNRFAYCVVENTWTLLSLSMTAYAIAQLIFNSTDVAANYPASVWGVANCRVFTALDKSNLDTHTQLLNSFLGGAGAAVTPYRTAASAYIVQNTDRTINCTSGTFNVTLPTALTNIGTVFCIKNSGLGVITLVCAVGTEEIDGSATATVAAGASVTVQSTGVGDGYIIIG